MAEDEVTEAAETPTYAYDRSAGKWVEITEDMLLGGPTVI